ncbi:acyl dehydrogenase [Fusarium pseudoanthophilum]|uniref:Acyl dehydrogenase n=1 Tax=Fusarium pseudoanthophilum TaxID=48495 RepID=A0A8H5L895_9HYPO|nr:acyl dehydrogenase [Fusarium pseudoanthophilum]
MVHFSLTESQKLLRAKAAKVAREVLGSAYPVYSKFPDQIDRFRATRPFYAQLVGQGLLKALIPKSDGGDAESLLESAFILEELYAVDSSISIHLVGTALGLLPLLIGGTPEQKQRFLTPFISGEGDHLASLTHSEPGGTANHLEKGGKGLGVTARKEGDYYVVNGEKRWTTNSAGWDAKGATLSCLCARYSEDGGPEKADVDPATTLMVLLVTRDVVAQNAPGAYEMLEEPDLMGHIAVTGPQTRYTNFRVPVDHVLFAPGSGAKQIEEAFGITGAMVGAMAVGTMRAAFEKALAFAKNDHRGGSVPIIQRQSPADLLINAKMRIDSSRALVWKALDSLDNGPGDAKARFEACLEAKIHSSDSAIQCVYECMQVVGMTSYANDTGFPRLLADAAVFPLFDGGNIGIRRRQFQRLMCEDSYQPWANL